MRSSGGAQRTGLWDARVITHLTAALREGQAKGRTRLFLKTVQQSSRVRKVLIDWSEEILKFSSNLLSHTFSALQSAELAESHIFYMKC